jgi:hypothetical protein
MEPPHHDDYDRGKYDDKNDGQRDGEDETNGDLKKKKRVDRIKLSRLAFFIERCTSFTNSTTL